MKVGRRLAIKVLNVSKLVLGFPVPVDGAGPDAVTEPLDRALLAGLAEVVDQATAAFEAYDWTRPLEVTETFFWSFCDDYVELVKDRAYGGRGTAAQRSAVATLRIAVDTMLRLFAPVLPYATEEVWSWWRDGSVHRAAWPESGPLRTAAAGADPTALRHVGEALAGLRRAKTEAKVSQKAEITGARITAPAATLALVEAAAADLRAAGRVADLVLAAEGDELAVRDVELAPGLIGGRTGVRG